jgi:hypothetical protein
VLSRYWPADPAAWWVTCPPMVGGGAMIVSSGSHVAMKAYRFAIAPEPTRISA